MVAARLISAMPRPRGYAFRRFDPLPPRGPLCGERLSPTEPAMISKFDSLFAGHVDIEDVGYGGVPVNDRRYPNEHLATVFDKAEAMARLMDRHGYDTFWMAEHHFQHEGMECIPNVLMTALHLAHVTQRIKIGCGFNICPMWHPLRLAEDYA